MPTTSPVLPPAVPGGRPAGLGATEPEVPERDPLPAPPADPSARPNLDADLAALGEQAKAGKDEE